MKIVFFGTSEFAIAPLKALIREGHDILFVVTQPKKRKGRGLKLLPTPIEGFAKEQALKTLSFKDINAKEPLSLLKKSQADVFIVVDFGQILSGELLNIPELFCLNIHASLLPKYRGAAPVRRALLNGEEYTGVTIMKMAEKLDAGDVALQERVRIEDDDNAATLREKLSVLGAKLLVKTLKKADKQYVAFTGQDESEASYASKIKKQEGLIDWKRPAKDILNQVRALSPWPSAYTHINGKQLKVLEAALCSRDITGSKPGTVVKTEKDKVAVACKPGCLSILKLQIEGKKPLNVSEFLKGHPLPEKELLG